MRVLKYHHLVSELNTNIFVYGLDSGDEKIYRYYISEYFYIFHSRQRVRLNNPRGLSLFNLQAVFESLHRFYRVYLYKTL